MMRVKQLHVSIGKSGEAGENESPPSEFLAHVVHGCRKDTPKFVTGYVTVAGVGTSLVVHILYGIDAYRAVVDGYVEQAANPAHTPVDVLEREILAPYQVRLVCVAEFPGHVRNRDVGFTRGCEIFRKISLVVARLAVCGIGAGLLGARLQTESLCLSDTEKSGWDSNASGNAVFKKLGTYNSLLFQDVHVRFFNVATHSGKPGVVSDAFCLTSLGIPV